EILEALIVHGVRPTPETPPELARNYVRDLYKYEIRALRERYLRGEFPKQEYSDRVEALRRSYPELAYPSRLWVLCQRLAPPPGTEPGTGAWHRSLALELGTGAWHWSLAPAPGTGAWHWSLALEPGTGAWHWSLALEPGTDAWHRSLLHIATLVLRAWR